MSIRNISVRKHISQFGNRYIFRKPSRPFRQGDVLRITMPDMIVKEIIVGSPIIGNACSKCCFRDCEHCPRVDTDECIWLYTERGNSLISVNDTLECL